MERKAVICECVSNDVFLVEDTLTLGLEPVAAYSPIPKGENTFAGQLRSAVKKVIRNRTEIVRPRDVDDLVSRLSGMDIIYVVAGSEYGIPYCNELSMKLGFPHDDPATTPDRTDKLRMHRVLERADMHCVRSVPVSSEDDI